MRMMTTPLLASVGIPLPGGGEGEGAELGFSTDSDNLSEGDSGETKDRIRCN